MDIETIKQLELGGTLSKVCTSWARGYVSRKSEGFVSQYSGRYGVGYAVHTPSRKSTRYHYITYYVSK